MYSQTDEWLPYGWPWRYNGVYYTPYWYSNSTGHWSLDWGYHTEDLITSGGNPFPSGLETHFAVYLQCRNTVTGQVSGATGRMESGRLNAP